MNLFEASRLNSVRVIDTPCSSMVMRAFMKEGKPLILNDFARHWPCAQKWTLDYIGQNVGNVKTSRPSADGIYRYNTFQWMPFA